MLIYNITQRCLAVSVFEKTGTFVFTFLIRYIHDKFWVLEHYTIPFFYYIVSFLIDNT